VVVPALRGVTLEVSEGEFLSIAGPSGSGKTTLLNLIGCVDTPTTGSVEVAGRNTAKLSERELTRLRLNTIGFIFQSFNLVGVLDVYRNVELPLLLQHTLSAAERSKRVLSLLERVGLGDHAHHRPNELSGGQRQRVAIARALALNPQLLVADEPTSALDVSVQARVLELIRRLQCEHGFACLFISHDLAVVGAVSDEVAVMRDGVIVERGSTQRVMTAPEHPYTVSLLRAAPVPDPRLQRGRLVGARPTGIVSA
jgi:putative ABC transport system ATP-binding protein